MKMKKLWLDDRRQHPDGWVRAYTAPEAIKLLSSEYFDEVSLDHDLGACTNCTRAAGWDMQPAECSHNGNGHQVIDWIEEQAFLNDEFRIPIVNIHTDNGARRVTMALAQRSIDRIRNNRENRNKCT